MVTGRLCWDFRDLWYWRRLLIALSVAVLGTVPNPIAYAAGEVRIPDMNVLGEDLSLYGVGAAAASDIPGQDKERFLSDIYLKSGFFSSPPRFGQSVLCSFDAGSFAEASARAAFFRRTRDAEGGFLAASSTKFSFEDGRRRLLYGADFFYKKKGLWNFQAEPSLSARNYELPASGGKNIFESLTSLPVSLYSQTGNSFVSFSAQQLFMSGKYPGGFYSSAADTDFSSSRFSAAADNSWRDLSFSGNTSLSQENWNWADGDKSFSFLEAACSAEKTLDKIKINAGLKFVNRANDAYTAGKLLVSFPWALGTLTAGLSPDITAPQIEDIFSRRGALLRSFPGVAHDSWNNLQVEYVLSLFPAGLKISAARRDTYNFFYADESTPSPGSFKTGRYKRYDIGAEVSYLTGPLMSGVRFFYAADVNFLPAPRSRISLFSEYTKGPYRLNTVIDRASKGQWTDSFVNGLVKICYNLPSGTALFLAVDNILGEKVFLSPGNLPVSPYEWLDVPFFSAGVEIRMK